LILTGQRFLTDRRFRGTAFFGLGLFLNKLVTKLGRRRVFIRVLPPFPLDLGVLAICSRPLQQGRTFGKALYFYFNKKVKIKGF